MLCGQLEHPRASLPTINGGPSARGLRGHDIAILRFVISSREIDMPLTQQWLEDLQGFFEAVHAMIEGHPERLILRLVPSRADTQDQTPVTHLVDGRRHFRQDRRIAEGIARHQRADLHALCRFR